MKVGIVGGGIFGIAAAIELRARGHDVTVYEQGHVPNERASSTDVSKTIRRFYGEIPTYVELAERAGRKWQEWHDRLGRAIYFQIGQLTIESSFEGGKRSYDSVQYFDRRGEPTQILTVAQARERFPQFTYRDEDTCVFDPWAGYVASGQAVADLARLARSEGVIIHEDAPVVGVVDEGGSVRLILGGREDPERRGDSLDAASRRFDRVVVAAGVWLNRLLPNLGWSIRPTFQQMAFFEPPIPAHFAPGPMPVWSVNVQDEGWYGHPLKKEGWLKVANDLLGETVDPDAKRQVTPEFLDQAREFVARRMPELAEGRLVGSRACLYENSPDRHFVVDWVPDSQRVLVAGGGSGHGFKFGGSIGEVIADALEDKPNALGDYFRIGKRFGG
jgi:glycine/D-amino acid oxidase-like deaminating enzyme